MAPRTTFLLLLFVVFSPSPSNHYAYVYGVQTKMRMGIQTRFENAVKVNTDERPTFETFDDRLAKIIKLK